MKRSWIILLLVFLVICIVVFFVFTTLFAVKTSNKLLNNFVSVNDSLTKKIPVFDFKERETKFLAELQELDKIAFEQVFYLCDSSQNKIEKIKKYLLSDPDSKEIGNGYFQLNNYLNQINLVENEKIEKVLKNDFQFKSLVFEKELPLAARLNSLAALNAKIISFKSKLLNKN